MQSLHEYKYAFIIRVNDFIDIELFNKNCACVRVCCNGFYSHIAFVCNYVQFDCGGENTNGQRILLAHE